MDMHSRYKNTRMNDRQQIVMKLYLHVYTHFAIPHLLQCVVEVDHAHTTMDALLTTLQGYAEAKASLEELYKEDIKKTAVAVQPPSAPDDLPESFVMTRLDVELRQCEFRLVRYGDTGAVEPEQLVVSAACSGDFELQLRRSSWAALATLRSFNVREGVVSDPVSAAGSQTAMTSRHELIAGNWVQESGAGTAEDYVTRCRVESHAATSTNARGADNASSSDSAEALVERLSIDFDCVAIKIIVNWHCIKALINFFAVEKAPLSVTPPTKSDDSIAEHATEEEEQSKEKQKQEQKVLTPKRVVDLALKLASPVIVLPQDCSDPDSPALVLELGDVQFKRLDKVPAALMLDSTAYEGRSSEHFVKRCFWLFVEPITLLNCR